MITENLTASDFSNFILPNVAKEIIFLEEIGSTNDYAKELARNSVNSGVAIIASKQTRGRGRLGRQWDDGQGRDIYMSLLLKSPSLDPIDSSITLIAGLAVMKSLNDFLPLKNAQIKWPNDILVENKKLCGILSETCTDKNGKYYAIVGIGININREIFPDELKNQAVSLYTITGKYYNRAQIIKSILTELDIYYKKFIISGFKLFIDEYKNNCVNIGKTVTISERDNKYTAKAIDVTYEGLLKIEKESGQQILLQSGEVSLKSS